MNFETRYNKLKTEFYTVAKKILNYETRRELSDESKVKQYTFEILTVYNNFLKHVRENLSKQSEQTRAKVNEKFGSIYEKTFLRCLHTLKLDTVTPENYAEISLDSCVAFDGEIPSSEQDEFSFEESDLFSFSGSAETKGEQYETTSEGEISSKQTITSEAQNVQNSVKMPLTKIDYHNMCTRTMNVVFSGDPLALQPFIDQIESLEDIDEGNQFTATLKRCILMKLQGNARDCIPEDATVEQIKAKLKETIKPESSLVVEGRMMALKADATNFADYTKRAEALAEQFKRSLVLEGMPNDLANKNTIRKTIELCRSNSRLVGVKTVLSSTKFENAKEVIATFVTQTRQETSEQQVLHMQSNRQTNTRRFNDNGQRGRFNNNFQRNSNNGQNRGNNRNSHQGNQNGRNNFRGRQNQNWRNNNNNNNNWRGNNGQNRNNGRVMYAENETAPPPGASQAQQVQVQQAGNRN